MKEVRKGGNVRTETCIGWKTNCTTSKVFPRCRHPNPGRANQATAPVENDVVLLLIGEHSTFDVQDLIAALRQQEIPIAGGVFPGVIYGDQRYEAGIVADVLPQAAQPSVIKGLDTISFALSQRPKVK